MKPPHPLPDARPFLTIYTPSFRRPRGLMRCIKSVGVQTARADVEQIVVPDHVGYGIVGGLFGRVRWYAESFRGRYVAIVCDDDALVAEDVVAKLKAFVERAQDPEVVIVRVIKNGLDLPSCEVGKGGPPEVGEVDLCNYIIRSDVFRAHADDYGTRYEGDFDHGLALWKAGRRHVFCDLLWVEGAISSGRPEEDWP